MNKKKIINSPLYPMICSVYRLISLKTKQLHGGLIHVAEHVLFRHSRLIVDGKNCSITIGKKCRFRNTVIEVFGNNSSVEIMDSVIVLDKCYISIQGDDCHCHIGSRTIIGDAALFLEENNTNISIGEDCMIGRNVCLRTTDFHSIYDVTTGIRINTAKNVSMGNHVWLGSGVVLAKGASVADDSVVGEQSMVTKQFVQKNICLAGIPARILKENINWSREKI